MKTGRIFVRHDASVPAADDVPRLVSLEEAEYVKEVELQRFLEGTPDLLPGDQIRPDDPRRWLLIGRETGVPKEEGRGDWWSLDHLLVDQDGIPTLVECKRASDQRIRREVVAQMLDYAANATAFWSGQSVRDLFEARARNQEDDPDAGVLRLLDTDDRASIDRLWLQVDTNLKAGKVRLVFVADQIPIELQTMVTFLSKKLRDIEVFAVEVRQYKGLAGQQVLVAQVVAGIVPEEVTALRGKTNSTDFLSQCNPDARPFFEWMIRRVFELGLTIGWGTKGFSVRANLPEGNRPISFLYGYPKRTVEVYFDKDWLIPASEALEWRRDILANGVFREAGDRTLKFKIDGSEPTSLRPTIERVMTTMAARQEKAAQ